MEDMKRKFSGNRDRWRKLSKKSFRVSESQRGGFLLPGKVNEGVDDRITNDGTPIRS